MSVPTFDINKAREWVISESNSGKYDKIEEECKKQVKEFLEEYNIDNLKKLSGKELLEKMFLTKNSLTHELEVGMTKNILGIRGGSAYKFSLFKKNDEQFWKSGTPMNPKMLSDEEAIKVAEEELECLIQAINIINEIKQRYGFDDIESYKLLSERLNNIHKPAAWFLKYIILNFIEFFPIFVRDEMLKKLISIFNLEFHGKNGKYLNLGEINLFRKGLGISNYKFGFIVGDILNKLDNNQKNDDKRYWVYSPGENAKIWNECCKNDYMAIGWKELGNLRNYDNKNELKLKVQEIYNRKGSAKNIKSELWNFCKEIKNGDIVYAKQGTHKILGRGIVESDYKFDNSQERFANIRKVKWERFDKPIDIPNELGKFAPKALTDITKYEDTITYLENEFQSQNSLTENNISSENKNDNYTKKEFLAEVYISENDYDILVNLLKTKKNIILQGAPGTGKTFAAKRLAYSIIGSKDDERVKLIQFHQSYSYEDFIMGYRPTENGFKLETGVFYDFCNKAKDDPNNDYFFIIDEINRGNLSRIFGELFMLIESDKRGQEYKVNLLYDKNKEFYVPNNLYIIGLMNTADRSLAFLDYALRRRFAFFDMMPGFDNENFKKDLEKLKNDKFKNLIDCIKNLNEEIKNDESLGVGFQIGHSFFCNLKNDDKLDESLKRIVMYEILPLLREYWFDEADKIKKWSDNLENCIKDN